MMFFGDNKNRPFPWNILGVITILCSSIITYLFNIPLKFTAVFLTVFFAIYFIIAPELE
ncbi:hypothetical protein BSG1_04225 [Bacillus sp. SG-1]|nr:hypothetical protein BSG1_04225 [Bacillus sp. SG-1]